MSLEAILGEMIKSGLGAQAQGRMTRGAGAGGLEDLLGAMLGGGGAAAPVASGGQDGGGLGGFAQSVERMMRGGASARPTGAPGGGAGAGAGGLGDLLGAVLGGMQGGPGAIQGGARGGAAQGGGLGDLLGAVLGGMQGGAQAPGAARGGAPGGTAGGIEDILGALLGGGGGRSAAGGGAMAVLGGLALQAFKTWQAQAGAAAQQTQAAMTRQAPTVADADAAELVLRAMLGAAKSDGKLDKAEVAQLTAKLEEDGETSPEERALVDAELARPADPQALAALVRSPAQAAQVYAASIMAIQIDTEAERAYLRALAQALGLPPAAVAELHRMTGAPAV